MNKNAAPSSSDESSEFMLYQTEDGQTRVQVRALDETVWLTQKQLAELFQKTVPTINEHIQNIYEEEELEKGSTIRNFRIVQTEGNRQVEREVDHYNLDVIISVGYRVRSHRGTQFRQWATKQLRELIRISRIPHTVAQALSKHYVKEGDTILARRGDIGRAAFIGYKEAEWICGTGCVRVRPGNKVRSELVYRLVSRSDSVKWLTQNAAGQTMLSLSASVVANLPVLLPPLAEQAYIVETLNSADAAICAAGNLIEAKTLYKRTFAEQLFAGKLRFPDFRGQKWRECKMSDLTSINAKTLPENTEPYFHFTYIDLSAVSEGAITIPRTSISFQYAPSRARCHVNLGDILVATVRPYLQGFALINWKPQDVVCSTGFAVLTTKEGHDPRYIYEWLFTDEAGQQFSQCLSGSSFPAVSAKDVASMRLRVPVDSREESRMADALSLFNEEIVLLRRELEALRQQKQGLMQKLLNGQVRVKEFAV